MILDTSFLIDVMEGKDEVEEIEKEIDEGRQAATTAVSVMELREGIHLAESSEEEQEKVKTLLEQYPSYAFTADEGREAGGILANLKEEGVSIEVADVMIGAIARNRMRTVVTANPDHFEEINGINVRTY